MGGDRDRIPKCHRAFDRFNTTGGGIARYAEEGASVKFKLALSGEARL